MIVELLYVLGGVTVFLFVLPVIVILWGKWLTKVDRWFHEMMP